MILTISSCRDCPFLTSVFVHKCILEEEKTEIKNIAAAPDWCELKRAPVTVVAETENHEK